MTDQFPRITFGIIVLNGEPFVRYNLRALYPFAHQIVVVEGAAPAAANIATADGHSIDGTLEALYRFQREEDPDGKLEIVVRDGFWSEKDEQSQAYAARATGDYLWQIDIDEFYQPDDMRFVLKMLRDDPEIMTVSFIHITFWGGFAYSADGWFLKRGVEHCHRVFKWGPGFRYETHRPVTVVDQDGRNLRDIKWVTGYELARQNITMYHYSLVFPKQVVEKSEYYGTAAWAKRPRSQQWAQDVFMELRRPYRVHKVYQYPSWLEAYNGQHPPQIEAMRSDIEAGRLDIALRHTDDIERVLASPAYRLGRMGLKLLSPFYVAGYRLKRDLKRFLANLRNSVLDYLRR